VPATFDVKNLNDSGPGSLRQAVLDANADTGNTTIIAFDDGVTGTVSLATALPHLTHDVTVEGPGAKLLTVQRSTAPGTPNFGVFVVDAGVMAILSGLTVSNGKAADGGGILNLGSLFIADSVITGNTATDIGGGLANGTFQTTASPQMSVLNCTVSNNTTSNGQGAGGINSENGTLLVFNCTVSGNQAPNSHSAGGIGVFGGSAGVFNCTVANNTADAGDGGGVEAGGVVLLYDTIVAGNSAAGASSDVSGDFTSQGHNLVGNGDGSTGLVDGSNGDQVGSAAAVLDAHLGPLQDNGGAMPTIALLAGSPAIDAGDNTGALPSDQRGFVRVFNNTIDIGAFEVQSPQVVATISSATLVTASPTAGEALSFGISVSEAVTDSSPTIPGGNVHVTVDNGTPTDVALQANGLATFNLPSGLPQGNHTVAVTYDANGPFAGSNGSATFTVNAAPVKSDTNTSLSAPADANAGDTVTFTATVTSTGGTVTGTVDFKENGTTLSTQPVGAGGVATFSTVLTPGPHTVTAVYSGDTNFNPSTSPQATVTVKIVTATSLSASAAGVAFGQPVTLTAHVTAGSGTPAGSVTFQDGGTPLGTVGVDGNGVATLTATLGPGPHSLTAAYSGGGNFRASSSSPLGVSVAPPVTGDVSALVSVSQTPAPGGKKAKTATVTLTLVNGSGQVIQGPLVVVLNGLKPTVRVIGASGFTGSKKHRIPFVVLGGGLFPPGGQLSVALKFRGQGVHFATTVKAGSSTP
jgi:hypothetical protein